jgi:predicted component of type VI protein secretion system
MRGSPRRALALAAVLAGLASAVAAGCGEDENQLDVKEGEPIQLGELRYNVQITRFLNPDDAEDVAYLEGEPDPAPGEAYLAVFMTVENEGDDTLDVTGDFKVVDTRDNTYKPVASDSAYALDPGTRVGPGEDLPAPDTPAASGPIKGAMVLFLVDQGVTENRPLELEIPSSSGDGRVELDI